MRARRHHHLSVLPPVFREGFVPVRVAAEGRGARALLAQSAASNMRANPRDEVAGCGQDKVGACQKWFSVPLMGGWVIG